MGMAEGVVADEAKQPVLFTLPEPTASPVERAVAPADAKRGVRLRGANRSQMAWGRIDADAQLPEDHAARAIWTVVERLDLSGALHRRPRIAVAEAHVHLVDATLRRPGGGDR